MNVSAKEDAMNEEPKYLSRPSDFAEVRCTTRRPVGGPLKSHRCFCCGSGTRLSNHHIEPRDEGGSDSHRNKVTLCRTCHDEVEGQSWSVILARRDAIRLARYSKENAAPVSDVNEWMGGRTPIDKIRAIRKYCLTQGVFWNRDGKSEDFRQAFRTLNRLYCEFNPHSGISAASRTHAVVASVSKADIVVTQDPKWRELREKIDWALYNGTQEEWVAAIVRLANS